MFALKTCRVCGDELVSGESQICLLCLMNAPLWQGLSDDLRAHRLPRTAPVGRVWPWLAYANEDPFCTLIRMGKFEDRPELIEALATLYADSLCASGALDGVEMIIPVPMHWWKKLLRGYNQTELIAREISLKTTVPVVKALKATRPHSTQSRKSGTERLHNVAGTFGLNVSPETLRGRHVAIVDDILTTGATLSEAIHILQAAGASPIEVLCLAATPSHS